MEISTLIQDIESKYDSKILLEKTKAILRSYDIFKSDESLWRMVSDLFHGEIDYAINEIKDTEIANRLISGLMLKHYPGERTVKYYFIRKLMEQKDHITLFEMYANSSRVDICRVNGDSVAYEIKTELDTYNRLSGQIENYMTVFEKTYVICPAAKREKIKSEIPEECGIITYCSTAEGYIFHYFKKAKKSNRINPEYQLNNLSSEDMEWLLKSEGVKNIPSTKAERFDLLMKSYTAKKINSMFKEAVKRKYKQKWEYISQNVDRILPIDIQYFFKMPLDPDSAYFKPTRVPSANLK